MRVIVLGADGYLGWPTCMYLAKRGHDILAIDGLNKRQWEKDCGVKPLVEVYSYIDRINRWNNISHHIPIVHHNIDISLRLDLLKKAILSFQPDAIIHYAEQASAPFSHKSPQTCVLTQVNNIVGTLKLIQAVLTIDSTIHIIKLGTMGEYGTPNMKIEEGWLDVYEKVQKHCRW